MSTFVQVWLTNFVVKICMCLGKFANFLVRTANVLTIVNMTSLWNIKDTLGRGVN